MRRAFDSSVDTLGQQCLSPETQEAPNHRYQGFLHTTRSKPFLERGNGRRACDEYPFGIYTVDDCDCEIDRYLNVKILNARGVRRSSDCLLNRLPTNRESFKLQPNIITIFSEMITSCIIIIHQIIISEAIARDRCWSRIPTKRAREGSIAMRNNFTPMWRKWCR